MNFTISKIEAKKALFILIFIGSFILQFFFPWWICALVAFAAGFWKAKSAWQAFVIGGAALGLLWVLGASYWHIASQGILSNKVAGMFHLPNGAILTALLFVIAGLVGGNAAMSGYLVRDLFTKK